MNDEILKYTKVIQEVDELIKNQIASITRLLSDTHLKRVCRDYREDKEKKVEEGFNIFKIISDFYYRETFHSDIMTSLLQKEQKHNEGDKYLIEFIKLLRKVALKSKTFESAIDVIDFSNSVVKKEKGKIDILIMDTTSHKAIIIENKINDAPDTPRQLPRYKEKVENDYKCKVVAIVYLSLNGNKIRNEMGWEDNDKIEIPKLLINLAAYNETENDLYNGWIKSCINITNDIDALCVLRQYNKLIQNLGGSAMNTQLLNNFYEKVVKENDNYKIAVEIKSILDEFPKYLASRIRDRFIYDPSPFQRISVEGSDVILTGASIHDQNVTIRISCSINSFYFRFWDDKFSENETKNPERIIKFIGYDGFYRNDKTEMVKVFSFPKEEEQLYDFIREFKEKLKTVPSDIFEEI